MCGIIGVSGTSYSAQEVFQGLLTLQHRGQDGAGILAYDYLSREFKMHKEEGLVGQAISKENLNKLTGHTSIGHTRYSTIGRGNPYDLQPMLVSYPFGLGMVHNGNLVNYFELKEELRTKYHCQMISGSDLEVIQTLFALKLQETIKERTEAIERLGIEDLIACTEEVFNRAIGGYSVVGQLAEHGMFAFRDPEGIRPLVLGKKVFGDQTSYILASESVALEYLNYEYVRDVKAGELIFINRDGEFFSHQVSAVKENKPCMFEWIYFSSPESSLETKSVYRTRLKLGQILATKIKKLIETQQIAPDVIIPVPETSRIAAIQCAEDLQIPYREVLIKNRYIQRSFILNTQDQREQAVKLKLSPVKGELAGKRVLLVDDSIVRGTTSRSIIQMVRNSGAKEVVFASACAPIRYPCYFGIDFPDSNALVAFEKNEDQICENLKADKIVYLTENDIAEAIGLSSLCMACLDGNYPIDISAGQKFNKERLQRDKRGE